MSDNLLLAGLTLCLLSLPVAVVALLSTRAPRGAAMILVFGVLLLFGAAYLAEEPLGLNSVGQAWSRVFAGNTGS